MVSLKQDEKDFGFTKKNINTNQQRRWRKI